MRVRENPSCCRRRISRRVVRKRLSLSGVIMWGYFLGAESSMLVVVEGPCAGTFGLSNGDGRNLVTRCSPPPGSAVITSCAVWSIPENRRIFNENWLNIAGTLGVDLARENVVSAPSCLTPGGATLAHLLNCDHGYHPRAPARPPQADRQPVGGVRAAARADARPVSAHVPPDGADPAFRGTCRRGVCPGQGGWVPPPLRRRGGGRGRGAQCRSGG